MDFESLVKHPITGQTITTAIEDGREWGQRFLNDPSWHQNKRRMAGYVMKESKRSSHSLQKLMMGVDDVQDSFTNQGVDQELHSHLYQQVKLAATLFTIYEIDTKSPLMHPLIIAAAAGMEITELADYLGTQTQKAAIKKALMAKRGMGFWEMHRSFGLKLISQVYQRTGMKMAKLIPHPSSVPQHHQPVDSCGQSVMSFIHAWNAS